MKSIINYSKFYILFFFLFNQLPSQSQDKNPLTKNEKLLIGATLNQLVILKEYVDLQFVDLIHY